MNRLLEKGLLSEETYGLDFAYTLKDNSLFLPTEYKVLQNQTSECFVRCMRVLYNGQHQLFYLTHKYKPMLSMLSSVDGEHFLTITANLIEDILEVQRNGFLACENIDLSLEHIYVDPSTYKVGLVYLPVREHLFADASIFENELRTSLVKIVSGLPALSSPRMISLMADLSNGALSLEKLYKKIQVTGTAESPVIKPAKAPSGPVVKNRKKAKKELKLVSVNAQNHLEISVSKNVFVLGRKNGQADGVIPNNDKISRVHCKIECENDAYSIVDLQSANGTYVNRMRLRPGQAQPIQNGDIIRLATSDFRVIINE